MAGQAEKNIKSGAQWAGKQAKKGLATLGKKAAYGAGKLVKKGIDAFKKGPTHTVGESTMNVYERILNILLEARVDMFMQDRLDEGKAENKAAQRALLAKTKYKPPGDPKVGREEAKRSNKARRASDIQKPGSGQTASNVAAARAQRARS
jgi:hypothetical protein